MWCTLQTAVKHHESSSQTVCTVHVLYSGVYTVCCTVWLYSMILVRCMCDGVVLARSVWVQYVLWICVSVSPAGGRFLLVDSEDLSHYWGLNTVCFGLTTACRVNGAKWKCDWVCLREELEGRKFRGGPPPSSYRPSLLSSASSLSLSLFLLSASQNWGGL